VFLQVQSIDLFSPPKSKYRSRIVLGSLGLGIAGVLLGFSITAAFFTLGTVFSVPGSFFVNSYGFLAFFVPAYLLYAAFVLADPPYRPGRILMLCGLIIPFFTLALGHYWIREFDIISTGSVFIARAGRVGLGFFIFFLAALELLLVLFFHHLFFRSRQKDTPRHKFREGMKQQNEEPAGAPVIPAAGNHSLHDIYTEAAAGMSVDADHGVIPFADQENAPEIAAEEIFDVDSGEETEISADEIPADAPEDIEPEDSGAAASLQESDGDVVSAPESDEDVEKALAEAAEEGARHGNSAVDSGKKSIRERKRRLPYFIPVEGILKQYPDGEYWIVDDETRDAAHTLKETFKEFNIQVEVTGIRKGPVITMFEILPAPGIRLAKIENLADNIALRLAAQSVRIVAPIPGKHAVGVEVPNVKRNIVSFREIIEGELGRNGKKPEVPVVLGKDITGEAVTVDLVQMPHLLIAGATGSGKSVCVNSMILSILYQKPPAECRLILIDPKIVELKLYNDIPHLLTPVITEPKKAFQALQYCIYEMERRYACLDSMGVRDIRSYNRRIKERDIAAEYMPYIVVVIDEFADLMATTGKELESTVARLAAMSRAVGIHLVLATQRPSIDVITGLIKANIPSRIAFMVASKMDSRIIIDMVGAEKLLGKGDMLYAGVVDPFPIRMQGAFISEEEVERVVDYVKTLGEPDYIDDEIFFDDEEENADPSLFSDGDDPLYEKALEIVMQQGKASASYIQRRLKIGYNRSARLVEEMEHRGVVGPANGSKPRDLLHGV